MKKVLCIVLAVLTLVILPVQVSAQTEVGDMDFRLLDENPVESAEIRTRKEVDGLRMYVDEENPLFMIRNCPFWRPNPTGAQLAEEAIKTYYALPEDIRNFSVIYIDEGTTYLTVEQQLAFWDELLTETAKYNVPIVAQSECFCTNKEREPFTQQQLSDMLKKHDNLIGFVQVELSTNGVTNEKLATDAVSVDEGVNKNILKRLKSCIKACAENGALFIWQDMEYIYWKKANYVNHILKDRELYNLLKENSENVIIMDKHNAHGRHFANQANILGCWLDDVCGNWGVNLENFLWYEEGLMEYDDLGTAPNECDPMWTAKYPPSLFGIDLISDLVAGATVYSLEGTFSRGGMYHVINGEVVLTPTFYDVFYPLYRMILDYAIPDKQEVKSNIKVAYKMTTPVSNALKGNDAHLLQGLYCNNLTWFDENLSKTYDNCTKNWVMSTGRYYIVPILPIYSDPEEVLPDSFILNDFNYFFRLMFIDFFKVKFFNEMYEEKYEGNGVLFDIKDRVYVFNSNEYKTIDSRQNVKYTLPESKKEMTASFVAHTYAVFEENDDKIEIDLCNLRLDTDDVVNFRESENDFLISYAAGGKRSDPKNFRESVITLSGYEEEPTVDATGSNNAKLKTQWNPLTGTLTLTIISNGEVRISVE